MGRIGYQDTRVFERNVDNGKVGGLGDWGIYAIRLDCDYVFVGLWRCYIKCNYWVVDFGYISSGSALPP